MRADLQTNLSRLLEMLAFVLHNISGSFIVPKKSNLAE